MQARGRPGPAGSILAADVMGTLCFFASDLHGDVPRYRRLFDAILAERPAAVFLGGDLLPSVFGAALAPMGSQDGFISDFLAPGFARLRARLGGLAPRVFVVFGNHDLARHVGDVLEAAPVTGWEWAHERRLEFGNWSVFGYSYVPPTPFLLKDWERYDVSRFVDPGCVAPEEGRRSIELPEREIRLATIQTDLEGMTAGEDLANAVFLFHAPPHGTALDRAALDGVTVDHAPLDPHVGSIAVRRFVEARQPLLTLHGHVHESARLTGNWRDRLGATHCLSAAHDGPELALVRFDPARPEAATRQLIPAG